MATTYDLERSQYVTEWVPDTTPDQHWSLSPAWIAHRKQQAEAARPAPPAPAPPAPEPLRDFLTRLHAEDENFKRAMNPPPPVIDPALIEAEQTLREAVTAMLRFAKIENIVQIVRSCGPAREEQVDLIIRSGGR